MFTLLSYGEVLVDFLPGDDNTDTYRPMAGGAPANVAVAYAKLGGNSYFAGGISSDNFGKMLSGQLRDLGVRDDYLITIDNSNTAIVVVSLDENGERSFSFYRDYTADTLFSKAHFDTVKWPTVDIIHFCSNTLTSQRMFDVTEYGLRKARSTGKLVSFDVNLRYSLWPDLCYLPENVEQCMEYTDVLKLSREEADYLAAQKKLEYGQYLSWVLSLGVKLILVTNGPDAIELLTDGWSQTIDAPKIKAVDTTGAGDSFIAGFLYAMSQSAGPRRPLECLSDRSLLLEAAHFAARCGAHTCTQKGAFSALPSQHSLIA